jgi:hypothetical protein
LPAAGEVPLDGEGEGKFTERLRLVDWFGVGGFVIQ